jgi:hypothetical protein
MHLKVFFTNKNYAAEELNITRVIRFYREFLLCVSHFTCFTFISLLEVLSTFIYIIVSKYEVTVWKCCQSTFFIRNIEDSVSDLNHTYILSYVPWSHKVSLPLDFSNKNHVHVKYVICFHAACLSQFSWLNLTNIAWWRDCVMKQYAVFPISLFVVLVQ